MKRQAISPSSTATGSGRICYNHGVTGSLVDRRMAQHADLPRQAAWRHNHGWPAHIEVEDLEQIAHMALWEAAHRTDPAKEQHFRAIANQTMNSRITDYRRKLIGRGGQRLAINSATQLHVENHDEPAGQGLGFEQVDELRCALKATRFTEQQHKVLELILQDLSNTEISGRLGISAMRVSQIRAEVHKRLRPHMTA